MHGAPAASQAGEWASAGPVALRQPLLEWLCAQLRLRRNHAGCRCRRCSPACLPAVALQSEQYKDNMRHFKVCVCGGGGAACTGRQAENGVWMGGRALLVGCVVTVTLATHCPPAVWVITMIMLHCCMGIVQSAEVGAHTGEGMRIRQPGGRGVAAKPLHAPLPSPPL